MGIVEIKGPDDEKTFIKRLLGSYPGEKPWESKQAILATITCIVPWVYPPLADWIKENPELFATVVSGIMMTLKTISWTMTAKK